MSKTEMKSERIVTGKFRVSFPNVFKPKPDLQGKEKYSLDMLFKKGSDEHKAISKIVKKVCLDTWGGKPDGYKSPIKDGDKPNKQGKILNGYEDHVFVTAKTLNKPAVLDQGKHEILNAQDFYGGCYARASVVFSAYDALGNIGVTCYLQNIQKMADGDPFGNRVNAADEFDTIEGFDVEAGDGDDMDDMEDDF